LSGISIVICWRAISLLLLSTANFTRFNTDFDYDFLLQGACQRCALAAGGRAGIRSESRKKPEARKMPVSRGESHQSAARFVGWLFGTPDTKP
ncbi:MAG: hypothetical protein AB1516_15205, partial [Pseudomonadota bacterium]